MEVLNVTKTWRKFLSQPTKESKALTWTGGPRTRTSYSPKWSHRQVATCNPIDRLVTTIESNTRAKEENLEQKSVYFTWSRMVHVAYVSLSLNFFFLRVEKSTSRQELNKGRWNKSVANPWIKKQTDSDSAEGKDSGHHNDEDNESPKLNEYYIVWDVEPNPT